MKIDVLIPESPEEAVAHFGDGEGLSVMAGGTIMMQLLNYRRARPERVLMLHKAGLGYVGHNNGSVTIGAAAALSDLVDAPSPLGPCAANIGDPAIRGQATIGGNLFASPTPEFPLGDLQGPLLALGATVRSAGAGGERTQPVEEFLADRRGRLALEITFQKPAAGAFAALRRPHSKHYTPLAVSGARAASGELRLAATGAGGPGRRLPSAEAAAASGSGSGSGEGAGQAALADVAPADDALASAWYRGRVLPVLVERVLSQLEESS